MFGETGPTAPGSRSRRAHAGGTHARITGTGEWVKRVLGFTIDGGAASPDPMLTERLEAATSDIAVLRKAQHPGVEELLGTLAGAKRMVAAGQVAEASTALNDLESAIARARSEQRGREAGATNTVSLETRKLLIRWRTAQRTVADNVVALGKTFLALDEVQADPRIDEVQQVVADLGRFVPDFGDQLDTQLNMLMTAGPDKTEVVKDVRETLAAYRQKLESIPELKALEAFSAEELGTKYALHTEFLQAMAELDAQLPKAA